MFTKADQLMKELAEVFRQPLNDRGEISALCGLIQIWAVDSSPGKVDLSIQVNDSCLALWITSSGIVDACDADGTSILDEYNRRRIARA